MWNILRQTLDLQLLPQCRATSAGQQLLLNDVKRHEGRTCGLQRWGCCVMLSLQLAGDLCGPLDKQGLGGRELPTHSDSVTDLSKPSSRKWLSVWARQLDRLLHSSRQNCQLLRSLWRKRKTKW